MHSAGVASVCSTGHVVVGRAAGMNLALGAINMAEAAGKSIPAELLAEVYATVALSIKLGFPRWLQFLSVSLYL